MDRFDPVRLGNITDRTGIPLGTQIDTRSGNFNALRTATCRLRPKRCAAKIPAERLDRVRVDNPSNIRPATGAQRQDRQAKIGGNEQSARHSGFLIHLLITVNDGIAAQVEAEEVTLDAHIHVVHNRKPTVLYRLINAGIAPGHKPKD